MQQYGFSDHVRMALAIAREEGARRGSPIVRSEDVLVGLIRAGEPELEDVLARLRVGPDQISAKIDELSPLLPPVIPTDGGLPYAADAKRILEMAMREGMEMQASTLDTVHLFLGILRARSGVASRALSDLGITHDAARDAAAGEGAPEPGAQPPKRSATAALQGTPWHRDREWLLMIALGTIALAVPLGRALARRDILASIAIACGYAFAMRLARTVLAVREREERSGRPD